jgi:hypothetical protein
MCAIDVALPTIIVAWLQKIATDQGCSLDSALTSFEDILFWDAARAGYTYLNANPEDRASFDAKIALWDSALGDGLAAYRFREGACGRSASRPQASIRSSANQSAGTLSTRGRCASASSIASWGCW